jgi:hypothetical protein
LHVTRTPFQVRNLKAALNAASEAVAAEKFELATARQENERLQAQIVQVRQPGH